MMLEPKNFTCYASYLEWYGDYLNEYAASLETPGVAAPEDTLNITVTLHGPPSVTSAIQACLNIRSLREYLERQIEKEVGNIARLGTLALTCKITEEE